MKHGGHFKTLDVYKMGSGSSYKYRVITPFRGYNPSYPFKKAIHQGYMLLLKNISFEPQFENLSHI